MDYQARVDELIDGAAKPTNSLGLLEKYVKKMMLAWGTMYPEVKPHHLIFAADNGVVEEGVAAYPAAITYLQAKNMVDGRATISGFCRFNGVPYTVVDVGINHKEAVGIDCKVALGTKNFLKEAAMSPEQFEQAWLAGCKIVSDVVNDGVNLLSFGEMGIGNTTTSSAVLHGLTGILPEFIVGYGAAEDNEILKRKRIVVGKGVNRYKEKVRSIEEIMQSVGGFDLVAISAGMTECAKLKIPFIIDGFITAVAYACAARINRDVENYAIPSHISKEPGMSYALLLGNILAEDVPLQARLALGEGTGAVLMVSLLKTMLYTVYNTARLSDFDLNLDDDTQTVAI